jgi:hypothetical protein
MTQLANTTAGQLLHAMPAVIKTQIKQQAACFRVNATMVQHAE